MNFAVPSFPNSCFNSVPNLVEHLLSVNSGEGVMRE